MSVLRLFPHGTAAAWRQTVFVALVIAAPIGLRAQQDVAMQQYWQTETLWNPAAAGRTPRLSINTAIQTHAMGYEDAGSTMWAGADMAFDLGTIRQGIGASFLNDAIGLFAHKRFALQYAYHRQKTLGGVLSFGIQADMLQEEIDGTKADFNDSNDPAFPTAKVTGSAFDLSAGIFFDRRPFRAGLSVQHLTAPTLTFGETYQMAVRRQYNLAAAYDLRTPSPLVRLTPSAMLRTDLSDYRVDLTLRAAYTYEQRTLFVGANFAPGRSAGLFVGGTFRGVDLCYGYEANTSGLGIGAGQHELTIAYKMDLDLGKKGRNLHKSVRWL